MNAPALPTIPLIDLDLLRTHVAISESGSFSAAAAIVHRTPSAISMQIKKLEELLGRPVYLRDSRSLTLTEDGELLLAHARRMLALNRDIVARFVQPDLEGVVRLGATDDATERFLPEMLRRFAETHPGVTVDVHVEDTETLHARIRTGHLDLALVTGGMGAEDGEEIYTERLVWATAACGVAAEQDPIPISVWNEGCIWREFALDGLKAVGREWRVAFKSAHIAGQRAAVLADLAVAPLPASSLDDKIVEARPELGLPPLPSFALAMITVRDPSRAVQAAADHLRASFACC